MSPKISNYWGCSANLSGYFWYGGSQPKFWNLILSELSYYLFQEDFIMIRLFLIWNQPWCDYCRAFIFFVHVIMTCIFVYDLWMLVVVVQKYSKMRPVSFVCGYNFFVALFISWEGVNYLGMWKEGSDWAIAASFEWR